MSSAVANEKRNFTFDFQLDSTQLNQVITLLRERLKHSQKKAPIETNNLINKQEMSETTDSKLLIESKANQSLVNSNTFNPLFSFELKHGTDSFFSELTTATTNKTANSTFINQNNLQQNLEKGHSSNNSSSDVAASKTFDPQLDNLPIRSNNVRSQIFPDWEEDLNVGEVVQKVHNRSPYYNHQTQTILSLFFFSQYRWLIPKTLLSHSQTNFSLIGTALNFPI